MEERRSKIDTCGSCMTTEGGGRCFRLIRPSCKAGTMRTFVGAISGNDSPTIKLDDWKFKVHVEKEQEFKALSARNRIPLNA